MWTKAQLVEDLRNIGLYEGASVLVHSSLRAIGPIEGGAETLVRAFQEALGPGGTLIVPTFTFDHSDPAGWREPPASPEALERLRAEIAVFDPETTPTHVRWIGVFPEVVRRWTGAKRSNHPIVSFAALGANADFFTRNVPFHYPLGSESPLARLHQMDGYVLLLGVRHKVNTSLHLAEVWADVPYIHRTVTLKTGPDRWTVMQGSPECSEGFSRIEPVLQQARLLRRGYVGNAPSQLMRQQHLISMAVAMLQGDGKALLCDVPDCPWCGVARRLCAAPAPLFSPAPMTPEQG
jgi:aminoglycoside 3-N-acetyltransferase